MSATLLTLSSASRSPSSPSSPSSSSFSSSSKSAFLDGASSPRGLTLLLLVLPLLLLLSLPCGGEARKISFASLCPCEEQEQCYHIRKRDHLKHNDKEVIVMSVDYSEPRKTWKSWHWPAISSVISVGDPDPTLMCITHREGRRYGFSGKLTPSLLSGSENANPHLTSWIQNKTNLVRRNFADLILLDFLEVLSDNFKDSTMELVVNTTKIIKKHLYYVHFNLSLICLIPWEPPCANDKCDFITQLNPLCESFMLSADSFLPRSGEKCLAKATIPFPQLHLGFDKYMMNQLSPEKFILSIPWHGYAYHCSQIIPAKTNSGYDQCIVHQKDGACDFDHCRTKIDMNEMTTTFDNHFSDENGHIWHTRYQAPFFMSKNKTTNESTQIWYEDFTSLHEKYIFVQQMKMGGLALWSGNDLHYASQSWFKGFNDAMWTWILHGIYVQKDGRPVYNRGLASLPKKMAGIGMGCVFVGGFLGFIFGWGVFQRSHRKKRRQPFEKDMDDLEEDQHL